MGQRLDTDGSLINELVLVCRLLELTGAKDPKALEAMVSAMNISQESVSRDLMTYKVRRACQTLAEVTLFEGFPSMHVTPVDAKPSWQAAAALLHQRVLPGCLLCTPRVRRCACT